MNTQAETKCEVLVVEDDPSTADLVSKVLVRSGRPTVIAHSTDEAIALLKQERFAMVLLDHLLGNQESWGVLDAAKRLHQPIPVVVVTGRGSERVAVEALRNGAANYIIKDGEYWTRLPEIVSRTISDAAVARMKESLAAVVESSGDGIIGNSPSGKMTTWNWGAQTIFGYSAAEKIGTSFFELFAMDHRVVIQNNFAKLNRGESVANFESVGMNKMQMPIRLSLGVLPMYNEQKLLKSITVIARDNTDSQWLNSMTVGKRYARASVHRSR